jgi:hypothetical protein
MQHDEDSQHPAGNDRKQYAPGLPWHPILCDTEIRILIIFSMQTQYRFKPSTKSRTRFRFLARISPPSIRIIVFEPIRYHAWILRAFPNSPLISSASA